MSGMLDGEFKELAVLLGALALDGYVLRHRGPIGKPLPYTYTLHLGDADADGLPLDAAVVRGLFVSDLIDIASPMRGAADMLQPRKLVITGDGVRALTGFLVRALQDTNPDPRHYPLSTAVSGLVYALGAGATLCLDDDTGRLVLAHRARTTVPAVYVRLLLAIGFIEAGHETYQLAASGRGWVTANPPQGETSA